MTTLAALDADAATLRADSAALTERIDAGLAQIRETLAALKGLTEQGQREAEKTEAWTKERAAKAA